MKLGGVEALGSMSMEKNFKHWHGDIETTDNPLEAGNSIPKYAHVHMRKGWHMLQEI